MKNLMEELSSKAFPDPLTGLITWQRLGAEMQSRIDEGYEFCLMLFSLSRFGSVVEQHGHAAGDYVLREFGMRLRSSVRYTDVVCRWGADEFLIIIDCGLENALPRSKEVHERVQEPYSVRITKGELNLDIASAVAVTAYIPGQSVRDAVAHVDAMLHPRRSAEVAAVLSQL